MSDMKNKRVEAQIKAQKFNVHIEGYFGEYMSRLLSSGRYGNAAELVKEALREHEIKHTGDGV